MSAKFDKMKERKTGNGSSISREQKNAEGHATTAKRSAALEKSREILATGLEAYISLLINTTLPENRTERERESQALVLNSIPRLAAELNLRNVGEGTDALLTTCLNSCLVLRDQINMLRFQNKYLNNRIDKLQEGSGSSVPA